MSDSIHASVPGHRPPKRKLSIGDSTHADPSAPPTKRSGVATQRDLGASLSPVAYSTTGSMSYVAGDTYGGAISHSITGGHDNSNYMFSGATQLNIHRTPPGVPDSLVNATAHAAFHDSADRGDPPRCHPKTRLAILDKIMNWIQGEDTTRESSVMWLYGPAGSGKTAIAQSIAERLVELKMLLASYFFGRLDSSRNYSRSLIATIAYQIALRLPDQVRERITVAVNQDPHVFNRSLKAQIESLIVLPLQPLIENGYFSKQDSARVIIIDGLDECIDPKQQVTILDSLSGAIREYRLPLLFFLSSRPELEIKASFNTDSLKGLSTWLALENDYRADSDIKIFLVDELAKIKRTHRFAKDLPVEWPSVKTISYLVQKSSGQFIYASTVVKFVKSSRHRPQERLDIILGLRAAQEEDLPFSELDRLYRQVFSYVKDWEKVSLVLAFGVLRPDFSYYSREKIEVLLGLGCGDIRLSFCDLGSLIDLETETLSFYHASVPDFLLDKSRSGQFHIDPAAGHARLSQKLLRFFQNCLPSQWEAKDRLGSRGLYDLEIQDRHEVDLQTLIFHLKRAAVSEELERDICSFSFLRLFDPGFPRVAVYYIPEYLSALRKLRHPNADMIYRQQHRTLLKHIEKEVKVYYRDHDLNFLLVCFQEHISDEDDFFILSDHNIPWHNNTLRLHGPQTQSVYYLETSHDAAQKKYHEALRDIIKDTILEENYTSAALYSLKMVFPWQRLIRWPLDSGTANPWRFLRKAGRSEELINYIQNLPWRLMIMVEHFIFENLDISVQDYFAPMDISFHQDYTSLALYALRKVSELPSNESRSSDLIRNCCYLLKKAGRSEELINCIQNLPWRLTEHFLFEDIDISAQNYLVRMNIPSNQDYTSLALHAMRKVAELPSYVVDVRWENTLLGNSHCLLEKAGRSEELIDFVQHFPLQHIPGLLIDTHVEVDIAIQAYLVRMDIVSDQNYTSLALRGLENLSLWPTLRQQFSPPFWQPDQTVKRSRYRKYQLRHLSRNCVYMLEKAGQSLELIDLVQQLQSSWPKEDPPYLLPDTLETDKKNLHDAFVAYLRRTAPHDASTPTSQELETHTVQSVNL